MQCRTGSRLCSYPELARRCSLPSVWRVWAERTLTDDAILPQAVPNAIRSTLSTPNTPATMQAVLLAAFATARPSGAWR